MEINRSKYRNGLSQTNMHVNTLRLVLFGSFVVIVFLMFMYYQAKETQLFRVPPDLRQGVLMRANDVSPPVVYGFAYYILQQLNHWPESGDKNFGEKIYYLQSYLTPKFREILIEEKEIKQRNGELRLRVRKIQEI